MDDMHGENMLKSIRISGRRIGEDYPCFIIAEAGINHNGSLDMALKLVDVAADIGADAVKFQKRHLPSLYPKWLLKDPNLAEWGFHYMIPALQDAELSDAEFIQIKKHCDVRGIRFMCTPWDQESLIFLEQLDLDIYKISSADIVNFPLIEAVVATGKPVILSTGMATMNEITRTVALLRKLKAVFALLHCVSAYPAPFENLNLKFINRLKEFGVPVGYSGHERGISIPVVALTMGAVIIEKHLTLDRTLPGPDHAASLEPYGFKKMIRNIRVAELAMGNPEKSLCQIELVNRQLLRKSLVAATDLKKGSVISREMVSTAGPGKGLSPQRINELLGVTIHRDIPKGEYFVEGDLTPENITIHHRKKLKRPWGFKSRFYDLDEIMKWDPEIVELHFSESDLAGPVPETLTKYRQRLFVHAPEFFNKKLVDFASEDTRHQRLSIELIQKTIDRTMELAPFFNGTPSVVIHVGGMSLDRPHANPEKLLERAMKAFTRLEPGEIGLLPENLPPRPWYLGGQWFQNILASSQDMERFCRELNLGMTLDLSHAQLYCTLTGERLDEYIRRCLPFTRHVHVSDAGGIDGEGLQIGEGVINWRKILNILHAYEFTWVPEIWSGHLNNLAGFIEAINRLIALGGL